MQIHVHIDPLPDEKYSEVWFGMRTNGCPITQVCAGAAVRSVATITVATCSLLCCVSETYTGAFRECERASSEYSRAWKRSPTICGSTPNWPDSAISTSCPTSEPSTAATLCTYDHRSGTGSSRDACRKRLCKWSATLILDDAVSS